MTVPWRVFLRSGTLGPAPEGIWPGFWKTSWDTALILLSANTCTALKGEKITSVTYCRKIWKLQMHLPVGNWENVICFRWISSLSFLYVENSQLLSFTCLTIICVKHNNYNIIYRDFLPPQRRGSHVKSDNICTIINIHPLAAGVTAETEIENAAWNSFSYICMYQADPLFPIFRALSQFPPSFLCCPRPPSHHPLSLTSISILPAFHLLTYFGHKVLIHSFRMPKPSQYSLICSTH